MWTWPSLLVAPVLALADQGIALALTTWACRGQHALVLHAVHAVFALATAAATLFAWWRWRRARPHAASGEAAARTCFLAGMALGASALSLLAILAMWGPTWVLSACLQ
jgi:hypothetical protein